jgi:hypothetical protein
MLGTFREAPAKPVLCIGTTRRQFQSFFAMRAPARSSGRGKSMKLAQNHIYVVPQNQAMTMNGNAESKTALKVINGRINGRFASGHSGNPGGSPEATRRAFNKRFLLDLAEDWQRHGREVFKRVRRESPAAYLKVCAMLVPKEMQIEHKGGIKTMSDEELEAAIEALQAIVDQKLGEEAKVIEVVAEPVSEPDPRRKAKRLADLMVTEPE